MAVAKKRHELYEELGSIVGSKYVSDDLPVLLSYTRDNSPLPPAKPQGVVVRPGSVEEVVELVRLANQTHTPLIPMGGKFSLAGVPQGQPGRGIIVDMRRMNKVIDIDEVNMAVTAQAGITLAEMAYKVNEKGWDVHTAKIGHYPITVGGQLSGFAGGGWGAYGFSLGGNWHYLLGMKVVLPNGSVVDTGTGEGGLNSYRGHTWERALHGPDLSGMFIGDGGIFGIKVEATYRMFRPPKFRKPSVKCWDIDNLDIAYQALCEMWEIDPHLYVQPYARAVILSPEHAYLIDPKAEPSWYLFWMCIGNSEEEIELKYKTAEAICSKYGGKDPAPKVASRLTTFVSVKEQPTQLSQMSSLGLATWFEFFDSRRDLLKNFKWTREYVFSTLRENGIDTTKLFIAGACLPAGRGCGISSYGVYHDEKDKEVHGAIIKAVEEFYEQGRRRGYLLEASHGLESRLRAKSWTPEYYTSIQTLKKVLDPNNIMNPGVYFL